MFCLDSGGKRNCNASFVICDRFVYRKCVWPLKRAELDAKKLLCMAAMDLGTFTTDAASKLDILGHDGDPLGVDGTEVGILKEADEISLGGFLQGHNS